MTLRMFCEGYAYVTTTAGTQLTFSYSKSAIVIFKKDVTYVQS